MKQLTETEEKYIKDLLAATNNSPFIEGCLVALKDPDAKVIELGKKISSEEYEACLSACNYVRETATGTGDLDKETMRDLSRLSFWWASLLFEFNNNLAEKQ